MLWSKHGFIAYANPHLYVSYLENVDGQQWKLASPFKVHPLPVSLVLWSNPSTDLAVADHQGNFYIYLAGVGLLSKGEQTPSYELTSYNHMEMIYQDILVKLPIVAFKWLNIEKSQIVNGAAVRDPQTKQFGYLVKQHRPFGATHPILTKQACLVLRKNGQLTLYYQGEHKVEYHRVDCDPLTECVNISHASIGFLSDGSIGLLLVDLLTERVLMYTVNIDWGFLTELAKNQKENPHYNTPEDKKHPPKLSRKSTVSFLLPPALSVDDELGQVSEFQFSNMQLLSCTTTSRASLLLWYLGNGVTKFVRYMLVPEKEMVPRAFQVLGERKGGVAATKHSTVACKLVDEIVRPGELVRVEEISQHLAFIYHDGIDVFSREMKLLNRNESEEAAASEVTQIMLVFDVGYDFPKLPLSETIIVSPILTLCAVLNDGQLQLYPVTRTRGKEVLKELVYQMAVAFAHHHAQGCYSNCCSDDLVVVITKEIERILKMLKPLVAQEVVLLVLCEAHKAINFQLDSFSRDLVDKLILNPPLQKLLLLQLALGGLNEAHPGISDVAWVVLNLRLTSFGIMFLLSSIYAQVTKKKPIEDSLADLVTRGERIMLLIGLVKWFVDLMIYIYQELFQLLIVRNNANADSKLTVHNLMALPIILGRVPRLFLMYALLLIGKTQEILKKLHKDLAEANKLYTPMKEALNRYFTVVNLTPLTLLQFENYLRECDAYITKELLQKVQGKEPGYSLKMEQKLLCQGELLPEFVEIANVLLDRHQVNLNRDMKILDVFFYNVEWLNVGVTYNLRQFHKRIEVPVTFLPNQPLIPRLKHATDEYIDGLRKTVISDKNQRLRRCTRCRLVSLVTDPMGFDTPPGAVGLWTMVFQRTCICGNLWVNC